MEIENDAPPRSALEDLVAALNAAAGAGTYAFIDTGVIGTDEIKTALIYKPAKVRPVGSYKLLTSADDPRFIDTRNRPVLAQTFELTSNLERVTVAVRAMTSAIPTPATARATATSHAPTPPGRRSTGSPATRGAAAARTASRWGTSSG
jgi:hypothetical protein